MVHIHGIMIVHRDIDGSHTILVKKLVMPLYARAFKKYINKLTITVVNNVLIDIPLGGYTKLNYKDDTFNNYYVYINTKHTGVINIIITDESYPSRIVLELSQDIHDLYIIHKSRINLSRIIKKYNKPENIDQLYKSKVELVSIKNTMVDNIDKIIERYVRLDTILDKANDLDEGAYEFYKTTKSKCCVVL